MKSIIFLFILPCLVVCRPPLAPRMLFHYDALEDHIWLIMQKDVNWSDDVTFKVTCRELPHGVEEVVQEGVTWSDLEGQFVTDGKLEGWNYAVLVDGLKPRTTYRIKETVTLPTGEVIPMDTMTYRTKGDSQSCTVMRVCQNGAGAWVPSGKKQQHSNRMLYQTDVHPTKIWMLIQRDVSWADDVTYQVSIFDTVLQTERVVQTPVPWSTLSQQYATSGSLRGWPFAVLADGLTPGRTYTIRETVRDVSGAEVWTGDTTLTTTGGSGGNPSPQRRCERMRVCPVGDGTYVPFVDRSMEELFNF